MQQSKVLCFNLTPQQRAGIESAALALAEVSEVPPADFCQTVGALIGVLPRQNEICLSPFKEPMLIMSSFDKEKMETILDNLKVKGVVIPYKAVVTPTNLVWRCDALAKELIKEHEQIRRMKNHEP